MTDIVASLAVEIGANVTGLTRGFGIAERSVNQFRNQVAGLLTVGAFVGITRDIVNSAIEWESAFAGVRKTVDGTPEQISALEEELRQLATVPGPSSGLRDAHTELAKIAELGGQLGIPLDGLTEFTNVVAQLGLTTDLTTEQAATMLAQFSNITQTPIKDYDRLGSTIVDLGNNGASTEGQILEFGLRLAGAGEQAGLAEDEILAFGSAMASLGLNPEAGGTAFTTVINKIIEATARGGEELDTLAEASGTTADAFRTNWESDPAGALVDFLTGLGEMTPAEQLATLDELGLSGIRVSDTLRRMSSNVGLVEDSLNTAKIAWQENTALQDEANKRYDTAAAKIATFENNIEDLKITLGEKLLPTLTDVTAGLNEFLNLDVRARQAGETLAPAIAGGLTRQAVEDEVFRQLQEQYGDLGARLIFGSGVINIQGQIDELYSAGVQESGGFQGVTGGTGDIYSESSAIGADVVNGVVDGIANNQFNAEEAMRTMVSGVNEAATSSEGGWGINSPSTVFQDYGKNLIEGLALGITENVALIDEPMGNLVTTLETGWKKATEILNKLTPGLLSPLNKLHAALEDVAKAAAAAMAGITAVGATGGNIPGRALGGPVAAGQAYIVGERGPELFMPGRSGSIVPNHRLGGGNTYILNAYGESPHELLRMLETAAREGDR